MRPLYLKFKGFGPYVSEQYVDFEVLEKSGLFLICGETGSGKTTILDAMTYALYGKSSGGTRGSLITMRCNQAGPKDDTHIEFEFEEQGQRYRFECTAKMGRVNINVTQNSYKISKDGVAVPIHENPTATVIYGGKGSIGDAQSIIGLSYEQFIQVIILPQGKFETLLTSQSSEKEKILVSIFHADRWQKIADAIAKKTKDDMDALIKTSEMIQGQLKGYGFESLSQMKEKIDLFKEELVRKNEKLVHARIHADEINEEYEKALTLKRKFESLDIFNNDRQKLSEQAKEYELMEERVANAVKVLKISKIIDNKNKAFTELNRRSKVRDDYEIRLSCLSKKKINAVKAYEEHCKKEEEIKQTNLLIQDYESRIPVYKNIEILKKCYEDAKRDYDNACKEYEKSNKCLQNALLKQSEALEKHTGCMDNLSKLYAIYNKNSALRLAKDLKPGCACPVCGSKEHPDVAKSDNEHDMDVTKEMIDAAIRENEVAGKNVQSINHMVARYTDINNQMLSEQNDKDKAMNIAKAEYENAVTTIDPDIPDEDKLNKIICDLQNKISEFENQKRKLEKDKENIIIEYASRESEFLSSEKELKKIKEDYNDILNHLNLEIKNEGFESEQEVLKWTLDENKIDEIRQRISDYKAKIKSVDDNIDSLYKELADKNMPDMEIMSNKRQKAQQEKEQILEENTIIKNSIQNSEPLYKKLTRQYESMESRIGVATKNNEFAKQLRGDSGIGIQRYILGVMLGAITVQANRLLENIHGGRYKLVRTDQASDGKKKAGLELEVMDSRANGMMRSVKSLSGGEKFLVALSLSIGLSTVAQQKGMNIKAMFIDEGFGSLDNKSVNDAMEVLSHIQRSNGIVGIISHVGVLRDNIPAHLEIIKGNKESTIITKI